MKNLFLRYEQIGEIFDCLSLGVILLSTDRKIMSVNRSAQQLTGFSHDDVTGRYCYEVFLNYLCGGRCKFLEAGGELLQTLISDVEIGCAENSSSYITKIESPLYGPDGEQIGCMEIFQDHSAFRELIKRIRFDDLRLKLILDNLDIGILTLDRGNHVTFCNSKAEQITGFCRSSLLGKPCKMFFGPWFCKDVLDQCGYPNGNKERLTAETRLVAQQGHLIPVRTSYLPLKNESDITVGGLITITDLSLKYHFDSAIRERYTFYDMIGRHPDMLKIFDMIPLVAATGTTVLIEGPTGTGKDLLAKIIHNASARAEKKWSKSTAHPCPTPSWNLKCLVMQKAPLRVQTKTNRADSRRLTEERSFLTK
jgi:PAS domain S-box-containing protein